jgi:sugar transferase (PEP-CTERM/EpsH1 system associated)
MKLLVILPRIPYPLEKGDKLRAWHQLRYLSEKTELHLCCLNDAGNVPGAEEAIRPYCKSYTVIPLSFGCRLINLMLAFLKGKPLQVGYFYSRRANRQINDLVAQIQPDHIYCQLIRTASYVENCSIPKTIDYQDVFSLGYERQASTVNPLLRPVYRREARLLRKFEARVFELFDHHTIIGKPDRDAIDHPDRERIAIIHNGVDTDYFVPREQPKSVDVLFTGNMNYPPNVIGAVFLVQQILPLLKRRKPDVRIMIAGANPSSAVKALASEQVIVTGWVDDIRDTFASAKVFVAPMTIGTGLQNKLLEAMAMRVPCVTSPLANAALEAVPGESILICTEAEEYAESILQLLNDPEMAGKMADKAFRFVEGQYRWDIETAKLLALMTS